MGRPEDIPEDIWARALECAGTVCRNLPDDYGDLTIEVTALARALLAERLEERDACASVASLYIIEGNSIHPDIPADKLSDNAKTIAHTTCQHVAQAIRSRP